MTNSKSVDNYGLMTAKPFVMNNRTYCLIDTIQFIICTIIKCNPYDNVSNNMMLYTECSKKLDE